MMRFLLSLLVVFPLAASAQLCSEPSPVSYAGFGAQLTQVDYFPDATYLDGLNNSAAWSIGSGISDNNLCVLENADITTFLGVKLRNTVAPDDNPASSGNVYFVEPGYSPASINGPTGSGPEAKWNILMYADIANGAFDSVEVILHIDFDPCFGYTEANMYAINIGEAFDSNPFTQAEDFSSFGINTNMGSTEIANLNPAGTGFDATIEGYYTFAIEVLNNCGARKAWNEVTVYVQSTTTDGGSAVADADNNGIYDDNETVGCQNEAACNYDCNATTNSVCEYVSCSGCTVIEACNFNPDATVEDAESCDYPLDLYGATYFDCFGNCLNDADADGICDEDEISGCQDASACNYDASASDDSGACTYASTFYNCAGDCLNDADGDGICNELEVSGCTDSGACNYHEAATDDDASCEFTSCAGCAITQACNYDNTATLSSGSCLFAGSCDTCSGEVDGSGVILSGDADGDGVCDDNEVLGCTDSAAPNFSIQATEDDGTCISVLNGCMIQGDCNYDVNATYFDLTACSLENGGSTPCAGGMEGTPLPSGMITTCQIASACNYGEEGDCEWASCVGCMNPDGCDYNEDNIYPVACDYSCYGCTNPDADNFDASSTADDGSCVVSGCTVATACNYDGDATTNDGTCEFDSCVGCMEADACNYDATATLNLTLSCTYSDAGYDCDGNCLNDADLDDVCDEFEIAGCTDAYACNYNMDATEEDDSCTYPAEDHLDCAGNCLTDEDEDGVCDEFEVYGCSIVSACNYDSSATEEDGSCEFTSCAGCTDATACNYDPTATLSNNITCTYILAGWDDCDQTICTDSDNDGICDFDEPAGCVGDFNEPHLSLSGVVETDLAVAEWTSADFAGAASDDTGVEETTYVDYVGRLNNGRYSMTRVYTTTDICANSSEVAQLIIADDSHPAGCTNSNATSFDSAAINDDGTCDYSPACLGDLNLDNIVGTTDLLMLLSSFALPCSE